MTKKRFPTEFEQYAQRFLDEAWERAVSGPDSPREAASADAEAALAALLFDVRRATPLRLVVARPLADDAVVGISRPAAAAGSAPVVRPALRRVDPPQRG